MAVEDTQLAYGGLMQGAPGQLDQVGTATSVDPTLEPGNYADSLFGVALPQGTGADGTAGAYGNVAADPTNEPGQVDDGLTGITEAQITQTGAPGSSGATEPGGGDTVSFSEPGAFLTGTNKVSTISTSISGTNDWTQAMNGYGTGGQMPGVQGNTPQSTGAGMGTVRVGGRSEG